MEWYDLIFLLIDMRSFSNLWYWIGLAVLWSSASHWVMGIPFDLINRARKDESVAHDLEVMSLINARRFVAIFQRAGLWMVGMACFVLAGLFTLAVFYRVEFAQAVLLMVAPMTLVMTLNMRLAHRLVQHEPKGEELVRGLLRHRMLVQFIGMIAILVTSMIGMFINLSLARSL